MKRRPWTADEDDTMRRRYPHELTARIAADLGRPINQLYAHAETLGLKKTAEYLASPDACRLRRDNPGVVSRFKPGHVPHNKGAKGWAAGGRSHETRFKKGQRGSKWVPIGTERVNGDGYLDRKIADTGYPPHDWKGVHRLLWQEAYGPIPSGYAVIFIDGNKRNVTLPNLCLVSRQELGRLNIYWRRYPREVAEVIQLQGALKRAINRRSQP